MIAAAAAMFQPAAALQNLHSAAARQLQQTDLLRTTPPVEQFKYQGTAAAATAAAAAAAGAEALADASAKATCSNTGNGQPFDCAAAFGPGWVPAKGSKDLLLTGDAATDGLACCDLKVSPAVPVDLFLTLQDTPRIVSTELGSSLEMSLVVAVRGQGSSSGGTASASVAAKGVTLVGSLPGWEVTALVEASSNEAAGPACSYTFKCPASSRIKCEWADVSAATPRRIVLSLTARDAGVGQLETSFRVAAAANSTGATAAAAAGDAWRDANPENNDVQLMARIKAACCAPDGSCSMQLRAQCPPSHAFSPTSSCAQSPCLQQPASPSRMYAGPPGICIRKGICLERMGRSSCLGSRGEWHSARLCKSLRTAGIGVC
ncbi:hypothetical protein OEZ85_013707 [Tetradesmus obliquus]|uniref:Pherophorin domain-containing protein n=1 Tax=Tetradesmus obliquus TaxID=3088 RepID=A0ABY8UUT8_TETOB|nr:hypothetical protein OEZ85_013707 [Tetradesmus obliquus]